MTSIGYKKCPTLFRGDMDARVEIESYLAKLAKQDFRQSLEPMREACLLLNNPQETFTTVHIAGTNGKGSTAVFLNSILQKAGYQVGLMTSPHLIDVTERIQINRQPIAWEVLWELIQKIRPLLPSEDFLSYFEIMTLVGFEYFSKMEVDIVIIETGMGGRLDATNVIHPQVAVLTPISHDHEQYLGETLLQIAAEKCGILKPEMTVVSAPQTEEVAFVIEERCQQLNLELIWADPNTINTPLGLKGEHQKVNAAGALVAAQLLLADDRIDEVAAEALQNTSWLGRLQYLTPNFLIDGAHNKAGIKTLAAYLKEAHPDQKFHFLVGCLEDKNWQTMFEPLVELAERFVCVPPPSGRALPAAKLADHLQKHGKPVTWQNSLDLPPLGESDLWVACGSLYMIGEVLQCFPKPD